MKFNREKLPLSLIVYAILIFVLTWIFSIGYIAIAILFLVGIFAFSITGLMRLDVSRRSMTLALLGYLGISFISLSKFKTDIANWDVDVNMISAGIALIGIAIALNSQYKEREVKSETAKSPLPNITSSEVSIESLTSLDVTLEEVRRRIDFQFEQIDGLVTKSGIVLGVAGVIFTLLVTNLLGDSSEIVDLIIARIALIPIFIALVLSFIPIYVMRWDRPPDLNRLRDYYIVKDKRITKLNVIDKCLEAIDNNKRLVDNLFRLIKCSYILLFLGLMVLAIWIGTNIW